MQVDYATFSNLIIDDIVFPDGQTFMNVLGGAGTHAIVGMRVWNDHLGYMASVGADLDERHKVALERFGVDLHGLVLRDNYRTARAWQVFEPDERRIEIFRTSLDAFGANKVRIGDLPEAYLHVRGFHLQWGTMAELDELVTVLLDGNPEMALVWEPSPDHLSKPREAFERLLPRLALFSPDIGEAREITGRSDPAEAARVLLEWGAPLVSVRMGERGSLLRTPAGEIWRVPAVPAPIVDVTGAGNSYCGGFLTGLGDGLPPLEAALRAAVSASFALQQFGMPGWAGAPTEEAEKRLAWARNQVKPLPT